MGASASPHVAGLAGLVFTRVVDTNGNGFLNDEVRLHRAERGQHRPLGNGGGRINAYRAVSAPQFRHAGADIYP